MEDKSNLEKITGNLATKTAGTAIGVLGATVTPLAAFVPFLLETLASGRQSERLQATFNEIELILKKHEKLIDELTDDQYKIINESVSSALYTINEEKLNYLVNVIANTATEPSLCSDTSDHLSRVIRDISADEIIFLLKNITFVGIAVTDYTENNDELLLITPGSKDELLLTGLMHLGLVYAKDSTWDFQVYKWSPIVKKLIMLLKTRNK
jgi:hypothetical protein